MCSIKDHIHPSHGDKNVDRAVTIVIAIAAAIAVI
jgi:hypothetical protein